MTTFDLRQWRASQGLTQAKAAQALGVALATYKDLERGTSRTTRKPVAIDRRTHLACLAISAGLSLP